MRLWESLDQQQTETVKAFWSGFRRACRVRPSALRWSIYPGWCFAIHPRSWSRCLIIPLPLTTTDPEQAEILGVIVGTRVAQSLGKSLGREED